MKSIVRSAVIGAAVGLGAWYGAHRAAIAEPMCFEADKIELAARTPWSHMWFFVAAGDVEQGAHGRAYRAIHGYGYNDVPALSGDGDLVPFTGSAVKGSDGRWIVSILGTLMQTSVDRERAAVPLGDTPAYWIISQNWIFDPPGVATGYARIGNLIRPFNAYPQSRDDGFDSEIHRIACEEMPR